jgi:hypothetical protein
MWLGAHINRLLPISRWHGGPPNGSALAERHGLSRGDYDKLQRCSPRGGMLEVIMGSLVPSFSLSRLRAAFSVSWNWTNRPGYQFKIRHQFELGGFDVKAGPGIDLDPMGLEWMRTVELSSRSTGVEYRMILFDDLDVILPGFPGPSPEMLEKMYGPRING